LSSFVTDGTAVRLRLSWFVMLSPKLKGMVHLNMYQPEKLKSMPTWQLGMANKV